MIPAHVQIVVCAEPTDMRYGFDRLAQKVRELGGDPQCGSLYVFANRRATRLKVMWFLHALQAIAPSRVRGADG